MKETKVRGVSSSGSVEKLRSINDGDGRRCACSENLQGTIATMWKENVNVSQLDKNGNTNVREQPPDAKMDTDQVFTHAE